MQVLGSTHEHRSSYQSWQQVSQTSHVQQVSQTTSHVQHNNEEYQSYEATSCSYSTAAHAAHIANKSLVEASTAPQDGDDSEDEQLQIDEQSSAENCGGDARLDPLAEAPPAANDAPIPTNTGQPSAVDSIIQSDVLQKLVMESVKKFLSESQLLASIEPSVLASQIDTSAIVSSLSSQQSANASSQNTASKEKKRRLYLRPPGIPDYKPTPIRELQKRKSVEGSSDRSRVNVSQADHESDTTDFSSPEEDGQDLPANLDSEAVTAEGASSSLKDDEPGKINDLPCGNDAELEADRIQNEADKKSETSTRVSSHVLVPVQVTRKTWKPSSLKATKPNTISGVLETTKTLNSSEGKLPTVDDLSKPPAVVPPTAQTSTQLMPDDSSSHTNDVPPSAQPAKQVDNDEEINSLTSTAAATDAIVKPGNVGTSTSGSRDIDSPTSKQCDDIDEMEETASQPRPDKCSSEKARDSLDDAESDFESEYSAQTRSSSGDRSSSRERRRRRRKRKREKKAKHKRSKSRKKLRRHSFSDDSDLEKDTSGNEIDNELNSDEENAESSAVKREIASEEDDGDSSEVPLSKKRRRLDESDTSGSKKPKSKTKKRKRSKHRKKSKRHRRRRYRSSSDSDSDWGSSSSSSRRSRKRRRRDIDLSFIKPDPEDVIDLTVIKDESDSSDSPCVKTAADLTNPEGLNEDKKQPIVTESVVNATDKDSETKESVFSSQPELKHRTASADSSNTIPFEDQISSPGSGPPEPPSGGSPCPQEPEEPSPNTNTTEIPPLKKTAALFSSKTKTLKEISIFDSLLDGGASSRIKTVKKKCVEELSSSSATPSAAEEEERLKKFTKTFTSRSSTTSTRHSSKEVESSSTSTHVSKSLVTSSSPSSSIGRKSSSSSKSNSRNTLDGDKIPNKSKSEDPSSKSSSSSNRSKNYKSHSESSSKSSKDRHDRSSSRSSVHKSSSHSSSRKHSSSSSSRRQSADPTKKDTSHKDTGHKDAPHKDTRQKDSRSSRKEKDLKNNASFEPAPKACASSQESEGVSDRDIFNFNNGPSHTSQSSDDEASAEGRDALSPLPDLSALDSIPDEDWDKLMSLDDGDAAEDECLQLYNDFTPPAPRPPAPPKKVEAEEAGVCGVQRVARPGAVGNLLGRPRPATARLSPHQVMMQRYAKLKQEQAALKQQLEEHKQHLSTQHHARVSASSSSGADSAAKTAADAALPLGEILTSDTHGE
ncbi:dentin sialophosphoprotein [Hyalella azteca]|uniref:Dentin sialophosphoprotein n=1 Tax=Hyalella azteca TaxID=294128 RepID=A0A979FVB6_HYAAZ|nr:dentin sialophosphoprotein [Hyalella azteca]